MTINDLTNKRVKLSAATITIKDDANKTRGMVRSVRRYSDAAFRDKSEWFKTLKATGIWEAANHIDKLLDRVYIADNCLVLLRDMRYEDNYNRFGKGFEADDKHFNMLQQVYKQAADNDVTVIPCFIA